jgi:hypothetical protein
VYSVLVSQGNVDGKEEKEDAGEDVHEGANSDDVGVTSFAEEVGEENWDGKGEAKLEDVGEAKCIEEAGEEYVVAGNDVLIGDKDLDNEKAEV